MSVFLAVTPAEAASCRGYRVPLVHIAYAVGDGGRLLRSWVDSMPAPLREQMQSLYREMAERTTEEAKLYKALDGLEALISHNESDISTWEPNEYDLQMTYAEDRMRFSPYMVALREQIKQDSIQKIKNAGK